MQSRFKPKFWKDINKVKKDKQLMSALYKVFTNVENAENVNEINNIKQLEKFDARYRIKLFLDKKRDYRIGLYVHGKNVWFARFLRRKKIYDANW
jgi:mRNA interferase RelE/StbE